MFPWTLGGRSPIGLEIGNRWVKAVQLRGGGGGGASGRWTIAAAARFERPVAARSAIEATEAQRLAAILDRQGFSGRRVTLVMPATMEITAALTLPSRNSGAPLDQMALSQLAETARCEPSSLTGAWWPRGVAGENGAFPAMAAGVRTRDADTLAEAIEAGGLEVVAVDVRGCALARACAPALDGGATVTAIVSIGHSAAMVVAVLGGVPVYERVLPESGLKELHERLHKNLDMEPDAIEYALARAAGDQPSAREDANAETLGEVRTVLDEYAQALAREVQVSLSYAASTSPGTTTGSAILVGDGAEIPGLCAMFGAALGQPARVVMPTQIVTCPTMLHGAAGHSSLVLACGLAMNDPRATGAGSAEARP